MQPTAVPSEMKDADLVCFTGGEDVDPSLYKAKRHPTTFFDVDRDKKEQDAWHQAIELGVPIIGICRGSQFSCVMSGGDLIQNMRHPQRHKIKTYDGFSISVTSSHHQSQYPWLLPADEYKILGWTHCLSNDHEGGSLEEMCLGKGGLAPEKLKEMGLTESEMEDLPEVEIAFYPKSKALAIQSHPEWDFASSMTDERNSILYFQRLLSKLLNGELK